MAQTRVQEEAAVSIQAKMLQSMKDTGEDLARLMDSANIIADPAKGNYINILA